MAAPGNDGTGGSKGKTYCADVSSGTPAYIRENGKIKYVLVEYPRYRSTRIGMPALVVATAAMGIALIVSALRRQKQ